MARVTSPLQDAPRRMKKAKQGLATEAAAGAAAGRGLQRVLSGRRAMKQQGTRIRVLGALRPGVVLTPEYRSRSRGDSSGRLGMPGGPPGG